MFHELHNFRDEDFFNENQELYVYTPEEVLVYHIFAAYIYSDAHLLYQYDFETEEGYQEYLDMLSAYGSGNFDEDTTLTTDDRILTMSTCTNDETTRLLVQARLVERAKNRK